MINDSPDIFTMEQVVKDFIHEHYQSFLPPHTSPADIRVLWVSIDRMEFLQSMADNTDSERERNFCVAVFDEFEMLFLGFMHAIGMKSLEISNLRQRLTEKNAISGLDNIDSYAQTG